MEQELLNLPKHLSSLPRLDGFRVTQFLVLCVMFCSLSFDPFFVWPLSVLIRYTNSDYPFGIFKLFLNDILNIQNSGGGIFDRNTFDCHPDKYGEFGRNYQISLLYRLQFAYYFSESKIKVFIVQRAALHSPNTLTILIHVEAVCTHACKSIIETASIRQPMTVLLFSPQ
jgi:hypothetical protein